MSDENNELPPPPWEKAGKNDAKPITQVGMIVDLRRCVGCHACAVACKTEHNVALGGFRIRTHYLDRPDRPTFRFLPMMCQHCKDAPCITACPNDAIVRLKDGRVDINKGDCLTARKCIASCPYDAIHIDPDEEVADKCNFCTQRTSVGMQPACVEACPTDALRFGDMGDAGSEVALIAAREKAVAFREDKGTRPSVVYIGHEKWMENAVKGVQLSDGENGIIYEH
jgi:tetrathionate reductase subunit B